VLVQHQGNRAAFLRHAVFDQRFEQDAFFFPVMAAIGKAFDEIGCLNEKLG